jgi:hypothetical protein
MNIGITYTRELNISAPFFVFLLGVFALSLFFGHNSYVYIFFASFVWRAIL